MVFAKVMITSQRASLSLSNGVVKTSVVSEKVNESFLKTDVMGTQIRFCILLMLELEITNAGLFLELL
jgi:hypothetical protein